MTENLTLEQKLHFRDHMWLIVLTAVIGLSFEHTIPDPADWAWVGWYAWVWTGYRIVGFAFLVFGWPAVLQAALIGFVLGGAPGAGLAVLLPALTFVVGKASVKRSENFSSSD